MHASRHSLDSFNLAKKNNEKIVENGESSPLAKFVLAKQAVNKIFNETELFMNDVWEFYQKPTVHEFQNNDNSILLTEISTYINRIKVIRTILMRDNMKVAFFGRTSNGKSSVINAILGNKILPSGIGHTTSCFISMKGCSENEPYFIAPESNEKRNVEGLSELAHALSSSTLGPDSLINVYWPISRCPILEHHVVFLDSPGIDVDYNLDSWIDQYCRDADVFVLVVNSESTLNNAEKNFFYKIKECISAPNIFIVNNRWDASASEPEHSEAIKEQHLKRCIDFLHKELKCVSHEEAIERVYFTSALEALHSRTKNLDSKNKSPPLHLTHGYDERVSEFKKFESRLKSTLYRSAIGTKFGSHCAQASELLQNVSQQLEGFIENSKNEREIILKDLNETIERKEAALNAYSIGYKQLQNDVKATLKVVNQKIQKVFMEEVGNLRNITSKFDYPFNSSENFIEIYKNKLIKFVEKKLESDISSYATNEVMQPLKETIASIKDFSRSIAEDEMEKIDFDSVISNIISEWFCNFDISTITSDFKSDLSFKFFFNPVTVVRWFLFKIVSMRENINKIKKPQLSQSISEENMILSTSESYDTIISQETVESVNPSVQRSIDDLTSTVCTSTFIFVGVGAKLIGLKLIIYFVAGISIILALKWLLWTESSKKEAFIKQFVFHTENKLMNTVKYISNQNCKLVEKNLETLVSKVGLMYDSHTAELDANISKKKEILSKIDELISTAGSYKKRCRSIQDNLNSETIEYGLPVKESTESNKCI